MLRDDLNSTPGVPSIAQLELAMAARYNKSVGVENPEAVRGPEITVRVIKPGSPTFIQEIKKMRCSSNALKKQSRLSAGGLQSGGAPKPTAQDGSSKKGYSQVMMRWRSRNNLAIF
jgi:hypothetical protein